MVNCVEEAEDLSANKLVVPIDCVENLVEIAVFVDGVVKVLSCCSSLLTSKQNYFVSGKVPPPEILCEHLSRLVRRGIVDDDDSEVGVLLLHDGLDVPGVPEVGVVLEGGNDDAGVQFFAVAVGLELVVIMLLLSFVQLFEFGICFVVKAYELHVVDAFQKFLISNIFFGI